MKTILLVDDECFLVESLTQLLEEAGYHVVSATNGKDGLAQLVKEPPDMVLTDFMMPVADGLEMVRGVRALPEFQSLPVVMMSAGQVAAKARRVGVSAFLGKPFGLDELLPIIERLIGKGEPENARIRTRPFLVRAVERPV